MAASDQRLPRIVWTLWLQGWDNAPAIAHASLASWRRHNPHWDIRTLDRDSLRDAFDDNTYNTVFGTAKPDAALSDQVRIELLHMHGGVWADATTICAAPLDTWLPDRMNSGFFAFANPGGGRLLSSWFLAAREGSYIITRWRDSVREYWARRTAYDDYFWFHHLFGDRYRSDPPFRQIWEHTPVLQASHPFHFGPDSEQIYNPVTPEYAEALQRGPLPPVFKLTHKLSKPVAPDSLFERLCAYGRGDAAS